MSELNVSTVDASSIKRNVKPVETEQPVSYTHLTLPTNREV